MHAKAPLCLLGFFLLAINAALVQADEDQQQGSGALQAQSLAEHAATQLERETPEPSHEDSTPLQRFFPRFRGRAVVLEITTRVIENNQVVSWNESHRKTTIPGQPIGIKLVGANVVVTAQFTPYIRRSAQNFLVAQGQIWMDIPGQGIHYYTSMQTIPLEFGEPIYFFPLGSLKEEDSASIEVMLTLYPYED